MTVLIIHVTRRSWLS